MYFPLESLNFLIKVVYYINKNKSIIGLKESTNPVTSILYDGQSRSFDNRSFQSRSFVPPERADRLTETVIDRNRR